MDEMDFKEYMIYLSIANTQASSLGRGDIVIYKKDRVLLYPLSYFLCLALFLFGLVFLEAIVRITILKW
jgi:hypothetical protein